MGSGIGEERRLPSASCISKFKREEHRRTKHDSSFSKWKILIGPTDWENHSLGKEGCERYRVHNLPASSSPGVYEIGVAVWVSGSGREVGKLDPGRIVVAYLGQAESVRSRLQSYGRRGAHLEKTEKKNSNFICDDIVAYGYGRSSGDRAVSCGESSSRGLFAEIFARGYPVVYRWAPLNSKKDAERAESKLLAVFDYPWNKVGNGSRRPNDVLHKIDQISSKSSSSSISTLKIFKLLKSLTQKPAVGIPIKSMQKLPPTNKLTRDEENDDAYQQLRNLHGRVLKFGRSNPRIVRASTSSTCYVNQNANDGVCGVRIDDGGSVCMNHPVKGRKRCLEHKGKKKFSGNFRSESAITNLVYMPEPEPTDRNAIGFLPAQGRKIALRTEGNALDNPVTSVADLEYEEEKISSFSEKGASRSNGYVGDGEKNFSPICGVILCDGYPCNLEPVSGRKRCEKHKGRRIQQISAVPC